MRHFLLALASLSSIAFLTSSRAEDWREFRGPTGQGLYDGKGLPIEWSTTKNVAWKQAIPGRGWSSPIVLDGRVYLTSAIAVSSSKDQSLKAMALDAGSGNVLWKTEVFRQDGAKAPNIHPKNSHASPSPVTDGKRFYVHFGHQGTACLDLDGKVVWRNRDLRYAPVHGNGGSPILVGDKLIFSCDGGDKQFVVALDTATGKPRWKTERKSTAVKKFSFSTPLAIAVDGKTQIISPGSDAVVAYDAASGSELWRAKYDGYSVIPRPVFGLGMVFLSSGYDNPKLYAIKVDGKGDVTESHIAWTLAKNAPHTPSPLLVDAELYTISDRGMASCIDARTGTIHWQERLGGNFSASPLHADGRIYLQSEDGATTVIRAGTKFEKVGESRLEERTFASYAVADGAIYLRTEKHLYRIQAK
ncbi:MAG: PQQ-like beta-propeller repeat protein [Planctomycetes bacterium]|nr:PQQ-like beta-propeller repeat protein [Planctomycetota bacterium]